MVDPAALGIGRDGLAVALGVGRHDLAVVAAGDHAGAIARRRQDRAAVDGNALRLAVARRQQQRFLAEDEDGGLLQEMHADHRRAGLHRPHALDD